MRKGAVITVFYVFFAHLTAFSPPRFIHGDHAHMQLMSLMAPLIVNVKVYSMNGVCERVL